MFYLAKLAQGAGLTVILFGFIINFPELMSYRTLFVGIGLYLFGWIIHHHLLKP